jgi:hypothetical protein
MNCGAVAFGPSSSSSFTVNSSSTLKLPPIRADPSIFASWSISTDFLKLAASSTVRVPQSLVFHVASSVQLNVQLFQLISAPLIFPVAAIVQFTEVFPAVSVH